MPLHRLLRAFALVAAATVLIAGGGLAPPAAKAATGDGSPGDGNIAYVGRWDRSNAAFVASTWAGAYLRVGFTGTTVKVRQRNAIDLWASIDGREFVRFSNVRGTVDLTPTRLAAGRHTLVLSYRQVAGSYRGDAVFGGLVLDQGASTFAPARSPKLIEFVGDSITAGATTTDLALSDYGWLVGERLGVEHTQIAQGGACLVEVSAAQSTRGIACAGLQARFSRISAADGAAGWDFSRYQANAVVINLGTNDGGHGVSTATYQSNFSDLLRQVRARYPQSHIFALNFKQRFVTQVRAAITAANNAGDARIAFVDTTGWVTPADLTDSVHPNDAGHRKIAGLLAPIIAAKL